MVTDLQDWYAWVETILSRISTLDHGGIASLPAVPGAGDCFLATDTGQLFVCYVGGVWTDVTLAYLLLAGGVMTGAIDMGANQINNLADPTVAQDAATKAYADLFTLLATFNNHKARHEDTGADEIDVGGLAGLLADDQHIIDAEAVSAMGVLGDANPLHHDKYTLEAHAASHENGGGDEIDVEDLSGLLADDQHIIDAEAVAAVEAAGLTLAALKKIIFANDGKAQFGVLDGSPHIFGGIASEPTAAWVQPKDGDNYGKFHVIPSGTETEAILAVSNANDPVNYGYFELVIQNLVASIFAGKEGTGTAPTDLRINLSPRPSPNEGFSLGVPAYRWLESWVMHRQLAHPLPVDHTWTGNVAEMTAGAALTIGQACYVGGDSKMEKADADAAASMPVMALATASIAENAAGQFLLQGFFRDDTWDWAIGGIIYASLTAGGLTQDVSGYTAGDQVQVVGIAVSADIIYFNPSFELVEIS